MELFFYLRHPILDEFHLAEAEIEAQAIEGLIGRQMCEHGFDAADFIFYLGTLRGVDR